ncbi:DUF3703 domain-containing protein [Comamonas endophytica]|uniref:DUF3703 domain-containing protein n=1 Tax=Comamonas endophytica TaxID=2949090 RepID=A0ABY6GHC5_9BURK|nr:MULTISPECIES: DUF3703 domain-containing protein [unclassified Acidovorax]MCD2514611.1 DUF3703 domain-containing protein [Acidovorax sp. D4N7]UYG54045.1 DUF3703 domain-containing protein [Acidovorax sp. 5MLIR]
MTTRFARNIRPHVSAELRAAKAALRAGQTLQAFSHLERAHVLGQASTVEHVRVHWRMLLWGLRQRSLRECLGQILRIVGAATKTAAGMVPHGNTGGTNVSPLRRMPVAPDLQAVIDQARRH